MQVPDRPEDAEADLFAVFHWTPQITGEMDLEQLMRWHQAAQARTQTAS